MSISACRVGVQYKNCQWQLQDIFVMPQTNIHGKVIKVSVVERVGYGVQITAQGNEKSCLVTYEAMLGMAEAMGLFDEVKEQNND
ncbi:hypothetical protein [Mannheimia haemolytica]|uniref:hypothetical protein n=1 Tax=Mannheimia haemolytica TaxID=75985 RepID=UPI0038F81774